MIVKAIIFSSLLFLIKGILSRNRNEKLSSIVGFVVLIELLIVFSGTTKIISMLYPFILSLSIVTFIFLYRMILKYKNNEVGTK